jgi:mono/diheme cytochrome c family protein
MKAAFVISLAMLTLVGCTRHQPSDKPPVHPVQNMYEQPKYKAQSESRFFEDGLSMRPPVEGSVARGWLRGDSAYYFGRNGDKLVATAPVVMTMERLQRGRQRFDIYCSPCHGRIGTGQGIMAKKGMQAPPSFHEQRLRDVEDGHIFDVITNGLRNMPPYKYQIPVDDRWSIVGYVRALQRSQNATLKDVPPDMRQTVH